MASIQVPPLNLQSVQLTVYISQNMEVNKLNCNGCGTEALPFLTDSISNK